MHKRRSAHVATAVGLVAMIFGAVVALAPFAGAQKPEDSGQGQSGNLSCGDILAGLDVTDIVTLKDNTQRDADYPNQSGEDDFATLSSGDVSVEYRFIADGDGWIVEFQNATAPIFGYQIKQATAERSQDGAFEGGTTAAVIPFDEGQYSHLTFCSAAVTDTCVDDPDTAEDECNPCVDDPDTAEDECNPCVDDPDTAEDECNPCVEGDEREICQTSTPIIPEETVEVEDEVVVSEPEPEPVQVENEEVVNEPAPEPVEEEVVEVQQETVEVQEAEVVRTLPRTGSGTERLAGVGVALLVFGAVLVAGGQRRLAHLS